MMTRWIVGVLGLSCAVLLVALVRQDSSLRQVRTELEQVSKRLDRVESKQKDIATAEALRQLQDQIAQLERRIPASGGPGGDALAAESSPEGTSDEKLKKLVDEKLEERLKADGGRRRGGGGLFGERRMALQELGKELQIDPVTQNRMAEISNAAKKDIFDAFTTPRPEGGNLVDDFIKALLSGDQKQFMPLFARLLTEKVPGTNETYFEAAGRIRASANQDMQTVLPPTTYTAYQHTGVQPENIDTGYDPFGDYLKERGADPSKLGGGR